MIPPLAAQIGIVVVIWIALQLSAAVMVYAERKVAAYLQQRVGPTRVGPRGLLQPIADVVKLMFKEELRPAAADPLLFYLAAVLVLANSMSLRYIVNAQSGSLFGLIPQFHWFLFFNPIGFLIFFTAGI